MTSPHLIDALHDLDAQYAETAPAPDPVEAPRRRQPGVRFAVFLDGTPDPLEVVITNRERIDYEKTAARHKEWPAMEVGRNFAMTYLTWSAARRAGLTATNFDQWQKDLLDFDQVEDEPADPTR